MRISLLSASIHLSPFHLNSTRPLMRSSSHVSLIQCRLSLLWAPWFVQRSPFGRSWVTQALRWQHWGPPSFGELPVISCMRGSSEQYFLIDTWKSHSGDSWGHLLTVWPEFQPQPFHRNLEPWKYGRQLGLWCWKRLTLGSPREG